MKNMTLSLLLLGSLGSAALAQLQHPEVLNNYGVLSQSQIQQYVSNKETVEIEDLSTGEVHKTEINWEKPHLIEIGENGQRILSVLEQNPLDLQVQEHFSHIRGAYFIKAGKGLDDFNAINKREIVTTFKNHETDAGYVSFNPVTKELSVMFRGTATKSDIKTDISAFNCLTSKYYKTIGESLLKLDIKELGSAIWNFGRIDLTEIGLKGKGHAGIVERFSESYKAVEEIVKKYVSEYDIKKVQFGGHSLGGALATLAAATLKDKLEGLDVSLATIGSPRVGDSDFATFATEKLGEKNIARYWNGDDLISGVGPGSLGFKHVGQSFKLPSGGHSSNNYYEKAASSKERHLVDPHHVGIRKTIKNTANKVASVAFNVGSSVLNAGSSVLNKLKFW